LTVKPSMILFYHDDTIFATIVLQKSLTYWDTSVTIMAGCREHPKSIYGGKK